MSDPILERLDLAADVARRAGRQALDLFRERDALEIDQKGLQDRVSNADREIETAIRATLSEQFPQDGCLGEELGSSDPSDDADGGTWVIDPIDGTDCFVFGMPSWCIALAWVQDGVTKLGVIHDPVHDEMFTASLGGGAHLNGEPLRISDAIDSTGGLVGIGYSNRTESDLTMSALSRLIGLGGMFHRCGSGALSLAWVAAGRLIGYYEPHMNSWDCLAGLLLVREAGGWTNDYLEGDGLRAGNMAAAAAPGMIDQIKIISGMETTAVSGDTGSVWTS